MFQLKDTCIKNDIEIPLMKRCEGDCPAKFTLKIQRTDCDIDCENDVVITWDSVLTPDDNAINVADRYYKNTYTITAPKNIRQVTSTDLSTGLKMSSVGRYDSTEVKYVIYFKCTGE
jgi:hypothetical protein